MQVLDNAADWRRILATAAAAADLSAASLDAVAALAKLAAATARGVRGVADTDLGVEGFDTEPERETTARGVPALGAEAGVAAGATDLPERERGDTPSEKFLPEELPLLSTDR
jgi:hypothetical protein